jgi:hypothetical protein
MGQNSLQDMSSKTMKKINKYSKIVSAPQDETTTLQPYIDLILGALGHPEAYVTDESTIWDFMPLEEDKDQRLFEISGLLGLDVTTKDYLVDIARKLKDREQ